MSDALSHQNLLNNNNNNNFHSEIRAYTGDINNPKEMTFPEKRKKLQTN